MDESHDGPILGPDDLLLAYGFVLPPPPPGAVGQKIWINGRYIGYIPDDRWTRLRDRVQIGDVGGALDGISDQAG